MEKLNKYKSYFLLSLPALLAIVVSYILQLTVISQPERYTTWLSSFGPYVVLVYILIQAVTLVIPPLGAMFIWIGMIAILGPAKGLLLSYLVTTPVYCLNFLLSKRYGRPLVSKVIGKAGMGKVDHYAANAGIETLWILKIFENSYFDYISYAAGLTKISFRDFLIVNFLGGIPSSLITYFILIKSPNFLTSMILIQITAASLITISYFINRYRNKKMQRH